MDAKITKTRLGRMLSYDWLKIIGLAAAMIIVWVLVFTMTATRITPAQQFTVFNYASNVSFSNNKFYDLYEKAYKNGVFSHEVLETNCNDLTTSAEYASTIMEARIGTDEGDVIFVPNAPNTDTAYTDEATGETMYEYTYLESLAIGYQFSMFNLDLNAENGYFKQMEAYLNTYYNGNWETGALDEAKVKADFRARIKKNKDKRYKTEKAKVDGENKDIERIKKYQAALKQFYGYYELGYVAFEKIEFETGDRIVSGTYYINLCPETDKQGQPLTATDALVNYVAYRVQETDAETGETQWVTTAKNMCVAFFDLNVEEGFQYESLLFVNYLLETCIAEGAAE